MTALLKDNSEHDALWMSVEEYLATERTSPVKREYVEGRVFAMAGATSRHNIIAGNIFASLHRQLQGRKCVPYGSDMKVKIPLTLPTCELTFYYPDVHVACQNDKELDENFREYPSVVFEVLSPPTAPTDEREKRAAYLRIPSLEIYCIVAQDEMAVTVYRRAGRNWEIMRWRQPGDELILGPIECEMTLQEIYDRVTFSSAKSAS